MSHYCLARNLTALTCAQLYHTKPCAHDQDSRRKDKARGCQLQTSVAVWHRLSSSSVTRVVRDCDRAKRGFRQDFDLPYCTPAAPVAVPVPVVVVLLRPRPHVKKGLTKQNVIVLFWWRWWVEKFYCFFLYFLSPLQLSGSWIVIGAVAEILGTFHCFNVLVRADYSLPSSSSCWREVDEYEYFSESAFCVRHLLMFPLTRQMWTQEWEMDDMV